MATGKSDSGLAAAVNGKLWHAIERALLIAAILAVVACIWRHETSIACAEMDRAAIKGNVTDIKGDLMDIKRIILERLPPKP